LRAEAARGAFALTQVKTRPQLEAYIAIADRPV